jgi:ribosomal protein S18 acetylase RimI-like enzyme
VSDQGRGRVDRFGESDLYYRVPDPLEDEIDELDCGTTDFALEEQEYFVARRWTGSGPWPECRCLQFVSEQGDVIGYAAFSFASVHHPTRKSSGQRDYVFVYHLCVTTAFQGRPDPSDPHGRKYSEEILLLVEELALHAECGGVYLNVRTNNARAKTVYERLGFVADGEYTQKATGHRMLRMRKVLSGNSAA